MPKADDLVKEVSAASIIAKVARDKYMYKLDSEYPEYGFSSHVGYGTAKHITMIRELGICPEHRKSFEPIKSMVSFDRPSNNANKNTTKIGCKGEDAVCEFLSAKGHKIIARNFRTKMCEIDIVSVFGGTLYFTEVKTRKNADFGGGLLAVNEKKMNKMKFAVEVFLKVRPKYCNYNPLLAVANVDGKYRVLDWIVIR